MVRTAMGLGNSNSNDGAFNAHSLSEAENLCRYYYIGLCQSNVK